MLVINTERFPCRAILIDFDDTLANVRAALGAIWANLLPEYGVHKSQHEVDDLVRGRPAKLVVNELFTNLTDDGKSEFLQRLEQQEETYPYELSAGAKEFVLAAKAQGLTLGIVISSWPAKVAQVLQRHGIADCFSVIVTRDDVEALKPDPDPYLLALEKLQLDKDDVVAIEDSTTGITTACAAGIRCIGFGSHVPAEADVLVVVKDFTEIKTAPSAPTSTLPLRGLVLVFVALILGFAYFAHAQTDDDAYDDAEPSSVAVHETFNDRDINLYLPQHIQTAGNRAMVVVLHGGMGNADFMEKHLGMDAVAEKYGFIVAYLNGSRAARLLPGRSHAWNAGGGCCGLPHKNNVNDVGYITGAVQYLTQKYGVNPARVFGMGHSNGAMMTQTLMCTTGLYQAAVPVSGTLLLDVESCPAAEGKRILDIHGADDKNVPVAGGKGTKGVSGVAFTSEAYTQQIYNRSGAHYTLDLLPDTDHNLDHINQAVVARDGITLAEKAARFFGLTGK